MEKYGVETEKPEPKEKTAQKDSTQCPDCGENLEDSNQTGQQKCPVHGTKPFEKSR